MDFIIKCDQLVEKKRTNENEIVKEHLFLICQVDPTEAIAKRVQDLSDIFCSQYTAASDTHPGSHETFAKKRLRMGEILYYKLLETILVSEKAKGKPHDNLLSQDLFHQVTIVTKNLHQYILYWAKIWLV